MSRSQVFTDGNELIWTRDHTSTRPHLRFLEIDSWSRRPLFGPLTDIPKYINLFSQFKNY